MIESVSGKRRTGKTSYVAARILSEDMLYYNERYEDAVSYIKSINKDEGFELTLPPQRHVVSANFDIVNRYPYMKNYPISGFEFGIPHPRAPEVKKLIPYGVYAFDEAQRYWDSKENKSLPPWVTQAFELSGHIFIDIYLISQRYMKIHRDIREIVDVFTYIEKSEHTYIVHGKMRKTNKFIPNGRLVKTKWIGRQFDDEFEIESYLNGTNRKAGRYFTYEFYGDISQHYDPWSYRCDFEDDHKNFDYSSEIKDERPASWDNYRKEQKKNESKN